MSKLVANGMFNVTAAAEKGAKPQFVYWDECPSSFKFCAGKDGEEVYHIVYNTRNTASSKYSKIPYLCIVSHTKNSTYPSDDVANSVNPKWQNFQTMALFATDLMLARKILAEEIDVDSLTVRNVSAVSSDGKTTCTIDGETGKLTAKNAEFDGVNAANANVEGVMTVKTLRRKVLSNGDNVLNGSIYISSEGVIYLPELNYGDCLEVKVLLINATRMLTANEVVCENSNVVLYKTSWFLEAVYGWASLQCDVEIVGYRYNQGEQYSDKTYWRILPLYGGEYSSITITSLT